MFPYNQLTRSYCRKTSWHDLLWKGRRFNFVTFLIHIDGIHVITRDNEESNKDKIESLKKEIMDKFQYSCQMEKFSTTIQFCRCHRALQSCARCYETKLSMHVLRRLTLALPANALLKPSLIQTTLLHCFICIAFLLIYSSEVPLQKKSLYQLTKVEYVGISFGRIDNQ
ncbi:hypothetical protein T4B_6559 [Trichinella pseudospiralis]|uniref:Uncharacterized protein n=1 Tax=Trichinella pseudospiralis TaxID=6337 RepID=A0A0V1IPJ8_TRIPS|nr:hypothetical protein T4B_6559 [Trichinella pseudospiralis]